MATVTWETREGVTLPPGDEMLDVEKARFQKLADALGKNFLITRCYNNAGMHFEGDIPEDTLIIWDRASESPSDRVEYIPELYRGTGGDHLRMARPEFIRPSDSGETELISEYTHSEGGYYHAQIAPGQVWFCAPIKDLCGSDTRFNRYIKKPIKKAADAQYFKDREALLETQTQAEFLKFMKSSVKNEARQQQVVVVDSRTKSEQLYKQLVTQEKRLADAESRLETIKQQEAQGLESIEAEFELLSQHVDFEKIIWDPAGKSLVVYTKQLYMYSPERKKRAVLGKFKLGLKTRDGELSIRNLTNRKGGRDHPHVENSRPCWGGASRDLAGMAAKHKFVDLFTYICGYLETYNPRDSWGRYAAYWFDEEGNVVETLCSDGAFRTKEDKEEWDKTNAPTTEAVSTLEELMTPTAPTEVA